MQRGLAIRRLVSEHLGLLQAQLGELRHVALRELGDRLSGCRVGKARRRRGVVRLVHVDEVLVVRGNAARAAVAAGAPTAASPDHATADDMMEGGIREPDVSLAVEADAVELHLHVVVAVARGVEQQPCRLVHPHHVADLEIRVVRQRRNEPAAEIVEVQVVPAVAGRCPNEATTVLEKLHRRIVFNPSRWPFFAQDDPCGARRRVARGVLQDVLAAVGAVEEQLAAVGRPRHAVDVVADDRIVERPAVPDVDLRRPLCRDVVDVEVDDGIRRAGLRIRFRVDLALNLRLKHLQEVVGDVLLVEPVVRDPGAIG